MTKKKLRKDISSSAVQIGITQVFALAIFYLISKYLAKDDFGEYNLAMAVGSTIITVASLGLDLIYVKRVASGYKADLTIGIHFFHSLFSGLALCLILVLVQFIFPALLSFPTLFLLVFVNLTITSIANSLKLCLNGLEQYNKLAVVSICTNLFKFALIVLLFATGHFTINIIVAAFIATSVLEFFLSYRFAQKYLERRLKPLFAAKEYKELILESLPQLGVVLFDSALARVDWILLGILSTAVATAEYSFAYKFFELSKLPMLIIAPVLLTRFSRFFSEKENLNPQRETFIQQLFKFEMFIAMLIPIVMVCIWSEFIDYFTNNKYGEVNELTYQILAVCVPIHYINNFLWTIGFVQGQLKAIMFITIGVSCVNILSNLLLIPYFGGTGAAVSFLLSSVIQLVLYLVYTKQDYIRLNLKTCLLAFFNAFIAVLVAKLLDINYIFTALTAVVIFVIASFITRLVSVATLKGLKNTTGN